MSLIYNSNASLYQRTNLIAVIFSDVEAMVDDEKKTSSIKENLQLLRETYEPIMDRDVVATVKKLAYDQVLDDTRTALIRLIDKENLVSTSNLMTVKAKKWGDRDE
ncbi:hypothetical protein MettiDRAFT_0005 [Methanolobus tindarius DSM 2278]|uniref:Uncharacterized protein n=1 Tax=Methanolobus tindarius DSM 2278 TaxID=1090322 RepID=W9DNP3_METTI|nr:hypothetical protein [Methanolobus tindarius]ETA66608.1 hypothetical protein MettiDRAFT_0005 [Methanolobus tindarius DSM 2278]